MKVSITLTLDIDPNAWGDEFGTGSETATIRKDVKAYVQGQITGSSAAEAGAITDVTVR